MLISEQDLSRRLGLLAPARPGGPQPDGRSELQRLTGLTPTLIACLALLDVLEPEEDRFSYRDLVAAREAGRLLQQRRRLCRAYWRRRSRFAAAAIICPKRVSRESPSGELVRDVAGQLTELNGQLTMPLAQDARSIDDILRSGRAGGGATAT